MACFKWWNLWHYTTVMYHYYTNPALLGSTPKFQGCFAIKITYTYKDAVSQLGTEVRDPGVLWAPACHQLVGQWEEIPLWTQSVDVTQKWHQGHHVVTPWFGAKTLWFEADFITGLCPRTIASPCDIPNLLMSPLHNISTSQNSVPLSCGRWAGEITPKLHNRT